MSSLICFDAIGLLNESLPSARQEGGIRRVLEIDNDMLHDYAMDMVMHGMF